VRKRVGNGKTGNLLINLEGSVKKLVFSAKRAEGKGAQQAGFF